MSEVVTEWRVEVDTCYLCANYEPEYVDGIEKLIGLCSLGYGWVDNGFSCERGCKLKIGGKELKVDEGQD